LKSNDTIYRKGRHKNNKWDQPTLVSSTASTYIYDSSLYYANAASTSL